MCGCWDLAFWLIEGDCGCGKCVREGCVDG